MQKGNICLVFGEEMDCTSQMTESASGLLPTLASEALMESGNLYCLLNILFTYFQPFMTATQ